MMTPYHNCQYKDVYYLVCILWQECWCVKQITEIHKVWWFKLLKLKRYYLGLKIMKLKNLLSPNSMFTASLWLTEFLCNRYLCDCWCVDIGVWLPPYHREDFSDAVI